MLVKEVGLMPVKTWRVAGCRPLPARTESLTHSKRRHGNQRIARTSCAQGFGTRFYFPNFLKSCSATYRNWTRSRISRSSWYLLALENSLDFNRTCKLAIASSWVAIAAEKSDLHFLNERRPQTTVTFTKPKAIRQDGFWLLMQWLDALSTCRPFRRRVLRPK